MGALTKHILHALPDWKRMPCAGGGAGHKLTIKLQKSRRMLPSSGSAGLLAQLQVGEVERHLKKRVTVLSLASRSNLRWLYLGCCSNGWRIQRGRWARLLSTTAGNWNLNQCLAGVKQLQHTKAQYPFSLMYLSLYLVSSAVPESRPGQETCFPPPFGPQPEEKWRQVS